MTTKTCAMGVLVGVFVTISAMVQAAPLGTAFTYQGQLKKDGQRVSDTCSFQFTLWDDPATGTCPTGGNPIGPVLCFASAPTAECGIPTGPPITVTEGLFTVQLDFGVNAIEGSARWLQIAVQCPGDAAGFTHLCPRQELTAAPYSLRTRFVDNTELTDTAELGSGTVPASGNMKVFNGKSPSPTITLEGSGNAGGGRIDVRNSGGVSGINLVGDSGRVCAYEFYAGGCDVAEAFELSEREKIEPGMVMVLDPDGIGHLRISTKAYDTKVAGIVSGAKGTKPGVLLGGSNSEPRHSCRAETPPSEKPRDLKVAALNSELRHSDSEPRLSSRAETSSNEKPRDLKVAAPISNIAAPRPNVAEPNPRDVNVAALSRELPIALSGRVYCLVDATKRAVKVGDLLTTSDKPRFAMKVTNFRKSQGALLGKAMEPLAKGEKGLILVLVGLQ